MISCCDSPTAPLRSIDKSSDTLKGDKITLASLSLAVIFLKILKVNELLASIKSSSCSVSSISAGESGVGVGVGSSSSSQLEKENRIATIAIFAKKAVNNTCLFVSFFMIKYFMIYFLLFVVISRP